MANGDVVGVYYTGTLTNGTVFDTNVGGQLLTFTVGSGQVIPGFDQGVLGMSLNQTKKIVIPVNEAYGPVNPKLIINVPLSEFKNQTITIGMSVTETSVDGQQYQGIVTAVNSTNATLDFNSKLAGQTFVIHYKSSTDTERPTGQSLIISVRVRNSSVKTGRETYFPPILNIFVPHTLQVPVIAGFPFFMVTCFASFISLVCLHFIQYPSMVSPLILLQLIIK